MGSRLVVLAAVAAVAVLAEPEVTSSSSSSSGDVPAASEEEATCEAGIRRKLYWCLTFPHKIQRSDPDGSNVEDIVEGLEHPQALAVDPVGGKLYWSDSGTLTDVLQRSNLDGSDVEDIVPGVNALGLAVDSAAQKVYWSNTWMGRIQRANLDGSVVEEVIDGLEEPAGVALDGNGYIYWVDQVTQKIQRSHLENVQIEDVVPDLGYAQQIVVDSKNGYVYWTDSGRFQIGRATLDGGTIEVLVNGTIKDPFAITLEPEAEALLLTTWGFRNMSKVVPTERKNRPFLSEKVGSVSRMVIPRGSVTPAEGNASKSLIEVKELISTGWSRPVSIVVAATTGADCVERVGVRRLREGDLVELVGKDELPPEASKGPLRPGDVGRIMADDRSDTPFLVLFDGAEWWYEEKALRFLAVR